jgi:hypothetical protein
LLQFLNAPFLDFLYHPLIMAEIPQKIENKRWIESQVEDL